MDSSPSESASLQKASIKSCNSSVYFSAKDHFSTSSGDSGAPRRPSAESAVDGYEDVDSAMASAFDEKPPDVSLDENVKTPEEYRPPPMLSTFAKEK